MKYRELSELVKIPPPAIWRYITLKIVPSYERAESLIRILTSREIVADILKRHIRFRDDAVDVSGVLSNIPLLKILAYVAYFSFDEVDTVLTVELDGVPIATLVADLFKSKLAVARKGIPFTSDEVYEVEYVSRDPPSIVRLYVTSSGLKKRERVLIVDDIIRSGRTTAAMLKLIKSVGASLVGVFSPIAIGVSWHKTLEGYLDKVVTILNFEG